MLILYNCGIYNPPKCGSHWMQWTMVENEIHYTVTHQRKREVPECLDIQRDVMGRASSHCYSSHAYVKALEGLGAPILTVVRHPLTWLRSYYAWREKSTATEERLIDELAESGEDAPKGNGNAWNDTMALAHLRGSSFSDFVDGVIETYPGGLVGEFLTTYTDRANVVCQLENLSGGFPEFLAAAGYQVIKLPTDKYSGDTDRYKYSRKAAQKMMEQHKWFCDKWGYEGIPEEVL